GAVGIGAVGPGAAHHLRWALLGQQVADRVAEGQLVVGEGEAHVTRSLWWWSCTARRWGRSRMARSAGSARSVRSVRSTGARWRYFRGSPSTRSAAMLRWISLVPA